MSQHGAVTVLLVACASAAAYLKSSSDSFLILAASSSSGLASAGAPCPLAVLMSLARSPVGLNDWRCSAPAGGAHAKASAEIVAAATSTQSHRATSRNSMIAT